MEELIDSFASYEVTPQVNSTVKDHPHFSLYKSKPSAASQEERRRKFLEAQKSKRYDFASHARGLATNQWDEVDDGEQEDDMDFEEEYLKPPKRTYKNQLMLSEWLVEVPCDLISEWLLVLCPIGKRCLVVSSRAITKVYTKSGYMMNNFSSRLPGGGKSPAGAPQHVYSLLDCIYNEEEKTFYILDVMCWNSHPCFDSDTEFRFFWLQNKIEEVPEVKKRSKNNPYAFVPLPHYPCEKESIKKALFDPLPFKPKLDGLLFYHKRTHYIPGTTPLVGWLKAYMLPEILQIEVPNEMAAEKPASYVCMQQHIPEAFKKNEERKQEEEKQMQYEDD